MQEFNLLTLEVTALLVGRYEQHIINCSDNFRECLFKVIHYYAIDDFLCKTLDVEKNKISIPENTLAYHMLGSKKVTYSADGFTTNTILEKYQHMNIPCVAYILYQVIYKLYNKFQPTVKEFEFLVSYNSFIPEGFEQSTLKGLYAFIDSDFMLFHRLLVLNIEPIIRHITYLCGVPTKKSPADSNNRKDFWEEEIVISKFLENIEVMKKLGSDNARELNIILFSEKGCRIRAKIAHGLIKDNEYFPIIYTL